MRPVSSRLMIAAAGIAGLGLAGTAVLAAPGGHAAGGGFGRIAVAGHGRVNPGGFHGLRIRTVGRGYGAGDFGRAGLGRGYGSGDWRRHGRGLIGPIYDLGGYGYGYGQGQGYADGPTCCLEGPAYPTASGIRAAPVAPPAVYVVGEAHRSGRRGNLRRGVRGESIEADSAMARNPTGVVSSGGARIIRVP